VRLTPSVLHLNTIPFLEGDFMAAKMPVHFGSSNAFAMIKFGHGGCCMTELAKGIGGFGSGFGFGSGSGFGFGWTGHL